jgi:short-subunit dehydrogenase
MIDKIKNLDIGILVNNVGTSEPNKFEDYSYNTIKDIFNINCTSMAVMTR